MDLTSVFSDDRVIEIVVGGPSAFAPAISPAENAAFVFTVPETLLRSNSRFFEAPLEGPWGTTGTVRKLELDDVQPVPFAMFVHWLYTKDIPQIWGPRMVVKVYWLAYKLGVVEAQNCCMDHLQRYNNWWDFFLTEINSMARHGLDSSAMIDYLMEKVAYEITINRHDNLIEHHPDLLPVTIEARIGRKMDMFYDLEDAGLAVDPALRTCCTWHVHGNEPQPLSFGSAITLA